VKSVFPACTSHVYLITTISAALILLHDLSNSCSNKITSAHVQADCVVIAYAIHDCICLIFVMAEKQNKMHHQ